MGEFDEANAIEDANAVINNKLRQVFDGRIVRSHFRGIPDKI